jgi:hypothetical protein
MRRFFHKLYLTAYWLALALGVLGPGSLGISWIHDQTQAQSAMRCLRGFKEGREPNAVVLPAGKMLATDNAYNAGSEYFFESDWHVVPYDTRGWIRANDRQFWLWQRERGCNLYISFSKEGEAQYTLQSAWMFNHLEHGNATTDDSIWWLALLSWIPFGLTVAVGRWVRWLAKPEPGQLAAS